MRQSPRAEKYLISEGDSTVTCTGWLLTADGKPKARFAAPWLGKRLAAQGCARALEKVRPPREGANYR